MIVPIVMVIGYSFQDNVILNKSPDVVGVANYVTILTRPGLLEGDGQHSLLHPHQRRRAPRVTASRSPLLKQSSHRRRPPRDLPRALRSAVVVHRRGHRSALAHAARPNGIVNFLLNTDIEWLASPALALGTVTFINIWAGYPFFMVSLLAGLQGIPSDLYEAATVDGASPVQRFWNVTIPQLRPIIVSLVLLDLIWTSQQFALIWLTPAAVPSTSPRCSARTPTSSHSRSTTSRWPPPRGVLVLAMSMIIAVLYVRQQKARD